MRNLASIQKIEDVQPIVGKDRIDLARVLGWTVVVQKGQFKPGDLAVYIEIDSVLPEKPEFEFLRPKKFHIKTMKLRDGDGNRVLSQGILFPLSILKDRPDRYYIGDDVTNEIGVVHYDEYGDATEEKTEGKGNPIRDFLFKHKLTRPLAYKLFAGTKRVKSGFPEFVAKTDETRIQNIPQILENNDHLYVGREKIDGQSGTFFLKKQYHLLKFLPPKYDFGVCSRNRRLFDEDNSSFWSVARKYNLRKVLEDLLYDDDWVCIQGEVVGPGIQGNKYDLKDYDLYCFNLIYPAGKEQCFMAEKELAEHGLKWAPLVYDNIKLPKTVDEVLALADGKSALHDTPREGIVFRNYENGNCQSFKAISNQFLLEHNL